MLAIDQPINHPSLSAPHLSESHNLWLQPTFNILDVQLEGILDVQLEENGPAPSYSTLGDSSRQPSATPSSSSTQSNKTPGSSPKGLKRPSESQQQPREFKIVFDPLSMPKNFKANPNNRARFKYHSDGTRDYLNAPAERRKAST
ncbi:hypothetical protein BGW36DRAFT_427462 [Talaromyces proteolyticus]|uniref:Uncharacterized protein n=1 Tax=Talaromyces proteolyticus TaxID=1131652 RepID=A0AAD4Q0S3_9EURO|nr:uncharacterized protein BGW36DRAFT_427462 [Talaromyces proteolyticus]KAH8697503.1 hypothetical protein BGW36DRAFT_427462 [Talaromyces proteolyticus]